MRLLIMLLFCTCILLILEKPLRKHSTAFYCGAVAAAAAGYLIQTRLQPGILKTILSGYLTSGTLPAALFVIVMYASVLPRKNRVYRCAMSARGEIAILASILVLTHIAYYGHSYGQRAGNGHSVSGSQRITMMIAAVLVLLLIPLTITSFKRIRRKMNAKRWKKLQKWSYLFYGLLYLHVAVVLYPKAVSGNWESLMDLGCYTAVFGIYTALRMGRYLERKKKQAYYPAVWAAMFVLLIIGELSLSYSTANLVRAENETDSSRLTSDDTQEPGDSEEEHIKEYADGTWEGEGMGLNGPIRTAVVVESGEITEIKITEREDDDPYFTDARQELIPAILEQQGTDVDVVSGATFSSEGILEAVKEALELAVKE